MKPYETLGRLRKAKTKNQIKKKCLEPSLKKKKCAWPQTPTQKEATKFLQFLSKHYWWISLHSISSGGSNAPPYCLTFQGIACLTKLQRPSSGLTSFSLNSQIREKAPLDSAMVSRLMPEEIVLTRLLM